MSPRHSRQASGAVVGGVLVILGTLLLLDRLNFIEIRNFFHYWPAILVFFGLVRLIQGPDAGARIFGGLLTGVGGVLLLNRMGITNIRLFDLWPVIIIAVGVALLYNAIYGRQAAALGVGGCGGFGRGQSGSSDAWVEFTTIFGGIEVRSTSQQFEGGNLTAIFGGCDVDLRRAVMAADSAVLNVTAIFGGISLRVPEAWTVVFQGTPVFGGYEDQTIHPPETVDAPQRTLYLRGTAAFGGIEVKN